MSRKKKREKLYELRIVEFDSDIHTYSICMDSWNGLGKLNPNGIITKGTLKLNVFRNGVYTGWERLNTELVAEVYDTDFAAMVENLVGVYPDTFQEVTQLENTTESTWFCINVDSYVELRKRNLTYCYKAMERVIKDEVSGHLKVDIFKEGSLRKIRTIELSHHISMKLMLMTWLEATKEVAKYV